METVVLILVVFIVNTMFAMITKRFPWEVLELGDLFCKKWVRILCLIPPFGIIGIVSVIVIALFIVLLAGIYMMIIKPSIEGFQDYFKKC